MKRSILSAVLASVLILSGCGPSEDENAKKAISTYLMQQQANGQMVSLKKGQADCISNGMVDGIGVDQLKKYHFLNQDGTVNKNAKTPKMSPQDSKTMVSSMFKCTDVMKTMQAQLDKSMGQQPQAVKDCFHKQLTEQVARTMLEATFEGDQQKAGQALMGPVTKCSALGGGQAPGQPSGQPSAQPSN